jgi:hypothetical protein
MAHHSIWKWPLLEGHWARILVLAVIDRQEIKAEGGKLLGLSYTFVGLLLYSIAAREGAAADQAAAGAQDQPAPAAQSRAACRDPEHRQFDFWLGEWEVRDPNGKKVGMNRLVSLHNGCAIEEHWTGAGGLTGTSLNAYDRQRRKWHQMWADGSGEILHLDGELVAGKMVLSGETRSAEALDNIARQRITWTPLPDARVRQLWETSNDGGKTWAIAFDGYYTKIK